MGFKSRIHLRLSPAFYSCILHCVHGPDVFIQSYVNVTANTIGIWKVKKWGKIYSSAGTPENVVCVKCRNRENNKIFGWKMVLFPRCSLMRLNPEFGKDTFQNFCERRFLRSLIFFFSFGGSCFKDMFISFSPILSTHVCIFVRLWWIQCC